MTPLLQTLVMQDRYGGRAIGAKFASHSLEDGARSFPLRLLGLSESHISGSVVELLISLSLLLCLDLSSNCCIHRQFEKLVNARHLFATAFNVHGAHLFRDILALLWCYWRQTLGLEKIDTCALGAEVRLEADENERSGWAEVENLRVPLSTFISILDKQIGGLTHTLSITFSKEFGQSMAKQTKRRSVSG